MIDFFSGFILNGGHKGIWIVFGVLIICGFGVPIPEDIPIVISGIMVSEAMVTWKSAILFCLAGILIGDSIIWFMGRTWGERLLANKLLRRIIHADLISFAKKSFQRYGNKIIFIGRFLPGLRTPIFFTSGVFHIPYSRFILIDGLAALISAPLWVYVGKLFGDNLPLLELEMKRVKNGTLLIVLAVILVLFLTHFIKKLFVQYLNKKVDSPPGS